MAKKPDGLVFNVWPHQDSIDRTVTLKASTTARVWPDFVAIAGSVGGPKLVFSGHNLSPEEWNDFTYLGDLAFRAWRLYFEHPVTAPEESTSELTEEDRTTWQRLAEED